MEVEAVRFERVDRALVARRETVSGEGLRSLVSRRPDAAVVYVVPNAELDALLKSLGDSVSDRGTKHAATQLSKMLLGQERMVAIRTDYRAGRSAKKSIKALLVHAREDDDRNVFLIGTGTSIYERLRDVARPAEPHDAEPVTAQAADALLRPAFPVESHHAVHDALGSIEVPEWLTRFYLGNAPDVQRVRRSIMRAAAEDYLAVLILGESGTGKDLVARGIHHYTNERREAEGKTAGKFVRVDAGAIAEHLLESELFGHERGSYTGADHDRAGLWRSADGGTLFLDEIADLIPQHQVKLLRAIEQGSVRPVGADTETHVTTRIIAATNKDLGQMVHKKLFRNDLFNRLRNAMTIRTPPLREHPDDVRLIADHYWRRITKDPEAELPEEIVKGLTAYRWPGNVRELEGVLMNLRIYFADRDLHAEDLQKVFYMTGQPTTLQEEDDEGQTVERYKLDCFRHLLRVSEIVRACKVSLRPMSVDNRTDPESVEHIDAALSQHVQDLDWLCRHPLLFYNEPTFRAVYGLKGKLQFFLSAVRSIPDRALRYYQLEMRHEFDTVLTALFAEKRSLA